jgi:hypothetical protein
LHDLLTTATYFKQKNTAKCEAGYEKGHDLKFQGRGRWVHSIQEITIHEKGILALNSYESLLRHHCSSYTVERSMNFQRNDLM